VQVRISSARIQNGGGSLPAGSVQQLVHEAHADDRADQRMRTRRRQTEIPRTEVPDNRGDQQREYHREAGAAADLQDQLDRQQLQDAERNRAGGSQDTEEVPGAGPDHRDIRRQRMRVDDGCHCVRGVVKAVDELEAEGDQQCYAKQQVWQDRRFPDGLQIVDQMRCAINRARDDHQEKDDEADTAAFSRC
jgi:hypothetical protein